MVVNVVFVVDVVVVVVKLLKEKVFCGWCVLVRVRVLCGGSTQTNGHKLPVLLERFVSFVTSTKVAKDDINYQPWTLSFSFGSTFFN